MATLPLQPLSEEEYLRIEREALEKSEYHDGQMFALSGGTLNHSLLTANMLVLLHRQVPPGCRVFTADLRIHIAAANTYTYPDCSIVCGEPLLSSGMKDNVLNPSLIVEVLSPSTENYDRGKKFELYRSITSFCEYLIVHQESRHVEHYSKQDDGSWILREHTGAEATFTIARWNIRIGLAELYASAIDLA